MTGSESSQWRKSSHSSGDPDACVEVCLTDDGARVRDTKNRDGGMLSLAPDAWTAFIEYVKGHSSL